MRRCLSEGILISILACAGFAQSYTISTVFGGPPPDNSVAKATTLPPKAVQVITADSAGNVYFAYLNSIFKLTASSGTISRVAGTVTAGYSGDNGPALSAQLDNPFGLAVDSSGNLYIADTGNAAVRKVSNGIITTVVGNGTVSLHCANGPATESVLDSPSAVAVDSSGTLYVTDQNLSCVVKVANGNLTRLAGTDNSGHSGDNGPAINASLNNPQGVAVDSAGNVYVADSGNNMIRKISNGVIADVAGIEVPASGSNAGFSGDNGPATSAMLNFPLYVAVDSSGNLLIADYSNNRVRKVSGGIIATVAGGGTTLGDGGPATSAKLSAPVTIGLDAANNLYIADEGNERIREVSNSVINTIAGNGGTYLNLLFSLALNGAGDLYIDDETSEIKKITAATGGLSVAAGGGTQGSPTGPYGAGVQALNANLYAPYSVAVDPLGNLFISVYALSQILEDSQGLISNVVGGGSGTYGGDGGPATSADLLGPGAITIDSAGDIYFVDGRPTTIPFHTTGPPSGFAK